MSSPSDRSKALLEKGLTGGLTAAEMKELEELLNADPELRSEWESLRSIREVTSAMKFREPSQETWDTYWAGVYARLERGIAWMLISISLSILLGYGLYTLVLSFIENSQLSLFLKIVIGGLAIGVGILLVSVLREKLSVRKSERYKEIIR